jgi:hypothetical protein
MKRTFVALIVGLAAAGSARADWGGYGPPAQQVGNPISQAPGEFTDPNTLAGLGAGRAGKEPDRYGLMPGLRKAFHLGRGTCDTCGSGKGGFISGLFHKGGCSTCGKGGKGGGGGGGGYDQYPQYPPMMQGTLVFPNSTYTRSPRDFFMYEPGR